MLREQNNVYWSGHAAKRVCIAIKADKGIEIEKIVQVSARIIVANVLLYGAPYELFVVMHLLKRTLIHQKTFSTIN